MQGEYIRGLIKKIKQKPELNGVDDSVVKSALFLSLNKLKISKSEISSLKKSDLKMIIKQSRAYLRKSVGMFSYNEKKRSKLLERSEFVKLIKTHRSTKERIDFYKEFVNKLNSLRAKSILDLGCGINPIALFYFGLGKSTEYFASDINKADLSSVNQFFRMSKINGRVFIFNLEKDSFDELPKADIMLLLKVFDIGKLGEKREKELILALRNISKQIIISFSTIRLSGKPMNKPKRAWFENIIRKLNLNYSTLTTKNEIFYLIS